MLRRILFITLSYKFLLLVFLLQLATFAPCCSLEGEKCRGTTFNQIFCCCLNCTAWFIVLWFKYLHKSFLLHHIPILKIKIKWNQLHAVSRTQQGRQREPSVKTLPLSTFCRILEALRVEWQNSTPRLTSTPERRNGNIKLSKYFISSSGDRTYNHFTEDFFQKSFWKVLVLLV